MIDVFAPLSMADNSVHRQKHTASLKIETNLPRFWQILEVHKTFKKMIDYCFQGIDSRLVEDLSCNTIQMFSLLQQHMNCTYFLTWCMFFFVDYCSPYVIAKKPKKTKNQKKRVTNTN